MLKLTEKEMSQLAYIRQTAMQRHENERRKALRRGRKDFPMVPYEYSWAYEEEFRRALNRS